VEAAGWGTRGGSSGTNKLSSLSSVGSPEGGVLGAEMRRESRFRAPISSGELAGGGLRTGLGQSFILGRSLRYAMQVALTIIQLHSLIALVWGQRLSFVTV
jgi:hypothetical protein